MQEQEDIILYKRGQGLKKLKNIFQDNPQALMKRQRAFIFLYGCFAQTNRVFDQFEISNVLSNIKEWRSKQICIEFGNQIDKQKILISLSPISFPRLEKLEINSSNLNSIQILSRFEMHSLKELRIGKNYLRSIKNLRKATFKNIQRIVFQESKVQDQDKLSEMYSKKLQLLRVNKSNYASKSKAKISIKLFMDKISRVNDRIEKPKKELKLKYVGLILLIPLILHLL